MGVCVPSSPVCELLKPRSLDAQPGTERRRRGGTDPPGAPGPCGPRDEPPPPGQQRGMSGLGGTSWPAQTSGFSQAPGVGSGKGRGPQEGRGLAREILSDHWGWGCFGATWNSHTGGRCPGCGHPEITCPLGLTCLRPDGLMRQENSLRRPALVLEPWTSCDLAGVLGPCQLSKDGVPSLQAETFLWLEVGPPPEGRDRGQGPLGRPSVKGSDFLRLTGK